MILDRLCKVDVGLEHGVSDLPKPLFEMSHGSFFPKNDSKTSEIPF